VKAVVSLVARIRIETQVRPTEDPVKVKAAVLNVFPDATFVESEGILTAEAVSMDRLREMFRTQRIRDTARSVLRGSRVGIEIRFSLNKQAAFVERANFAPPSPMGQIDVAISDEEPESVIDYLTGKTGLTHDAPPRGERR